MPRPLSGSISVFAFAEKYLNELDVPGAREKGIRVFVDFDSGEMGGEFTSFLFRSCCCCCCRMISRSVGVGGGGRRGKENPHQTDQNAWNAYENCKALLHCPTAAAWPPTFDP